jgi:hypothetical protein
VRLAVPLNEFVDQLILSKTMPSAKQLANAERNPTVALMALATNSGLGRFLDSSKIIKERDIYEFVLPHDDIIQPGIYLYLGMFVLSFI